MVRSLHRERFLLHFNLIVGLWMLHIMTYSRYFTLQTQTSFHHNGLIRHTHRSIYRSTLKFNNETTYEGLIFGHNRP